MQHSVQNKNKKGGGETRNCKRQEQGKHNWNETTKQPNKERTNQCQHMPRCVPPMCALARVEIPECRQENGTGHQHTDALHAQPSSLKQKRRWREKERKCETAQQCTAAHDIRKRKKNYKEENRHKKTTLTALPFPQERKVKWKKEREKTPASPSSSLPRRLYNISYCCTLPWIFLSLR